MFQHAPELPRAGSTPPATANQGTRFRDQAVRASIAPLTASLKTLFVGVVSREQLVRHQRNLPTQPR